MSLFSLPFKTISASLALWAERLLESFKWLLLWTCLWIVALLLFPFASVLLTVFFWLGFLIALVSGIRNFHVPLQTDVEARLERDSLLFHRPLRSRDDVPASRLSAQGEHFWQQELVRKDRQLLLLRWVAPAFNFVQRDPYALRIALVLLLFVGIAISGATSGGKIRDGLFPFIPNSQASSNDSDLKIVITPPGYTRLPQVMVSGHSKDALAVPQGSSVRALARSSIGHLKLNLGDVSLPLAQEDGTDAYSVETKLPETESISITQFGFPRLRVPVDYIKDQPPQLSLRGNPETAPGGQLQLPLSIQDDYGLRLVRVRAQLTPEIRAIPLGTPVFEEQSIIVASGGKNVEINPRFDLTGHPWAGYPVSLLIEVEDHAGQSAQAGPINITLPEKPFRNKVSIAIVEARKKLIQGGERVIGPVSLQIVEILSRPGLYKWDSVATLALRSSLSRLGYSPNRKAAEEVAGTLWPTALHLEDGNLTSSQADLRKALENLQKAMQDKKSPEEIARLMQEFRQALMAHLQATQREMQKRMAEGEMMMLDPDAMMQTLDPAMLEDFLSQLENELVNGDAQSAMEKLENLQKLSDMLDPSLAQPMPQDMQDTMQNMKDLQKLIDAQQALLDKTRSKQDQKSDAEKKQQDELAGNLNKLKETIAGQGAKPSENMNKSGEAMRHSSGKLGGNDPQGSIPHQQEALDQLRQGKKQMQQSLQQRMQRMMGMPMGGMPQGKDPLGNGKPDNGRNILNNETVKIPTEAERRKSDEILRTIRERSGDLSRPQAEREYYQRLLRQW